MAQSKHHSLLEQTANVITGFMLSVSVWEWIVSPLIERGVIAVGDSLLITAVFTTFSFVRGYLWRRFFNRLPEKA